MKTSALSISQNLLSQFLILGVLLIFSSCSNDTSSEADNSTTEAKEVYTVVEELPQAKGGMDSLYSYISKTITYPLSARVNGIEGRVVVGFVIERDGSLSNIEVVESLSEEIDNEALSVFNTVEPFTPGKQRGRTVRVRMNIPLSFKLDMDKLNQDGSPQGIIIVEKAQIIPEQLTVDASFSDGKWSGTVFNVDGEPLPGANIVVKGTSSGTVSDLDGTFSVSAESGQNIVISFVGYESQELTAE